ncbi:hypothetical protein K438DRAFT_1753878 [Mycena galopus ATCC 62051]|nr:hypothetical protein K438DRAFT_1753878 [Mycena galopus ATCC 62051]
MCPRLILIEIIGKIIAVKDRGAGGGQADGCADAPLLPASRPVCWGPSGEVPEARPDAGLHRHSLVWGGSAALGELAREDGEGEWVSKEAMEQWKMEERLRELRVEVAAEGVDKEMDVDDEEGTEVAGEDDEGHEAREEAVLGLLYQISMLAMDDGLLGSAADE